MNSTAQMGPAERIALEEGLERLFERRRLSFLEERELQTKPALTWQCWPSDALALDLSNDKVQEAMRKVAELPEVGSAMAAQFMRIYGRNLPKSK